MTFELRNSSQNGIKLNGGTDLDIQFIPDDVDFVEKKWRRDKTEKHTENAETSGQNGHRLHGKCSIQFFTTIHAPNSKQQPTGMNHCNSGSSFLNAKCKTSRFKNFPFSGSREKLYQTADLFNRCSFNIQKQGQN
ncbi:hypothetical protein T01_10248 [Trichinella spiralis]|uniref:Uncharacterized protein n=1 Tax=Trichinella spiralis TaxID=6334 RepID=A0A0V1BG45_TRISP|nr:hypothetical protein T01_10248 [Trichinella spiralis]